MPVAPDEMDHALDKHVGEYIQANAVRITQGWVDILVERLGVNPKRALPSESILNHIPIVLQRVAEFIAHPGKDPLTTLVREDLRLLADLRRRQGFPLEEILTEFGILSQLVEDATVEAVDGYEGDLDRKDIVRMVGRIKDAIYLLGTETAARFRTWSNRRRDERSRIFEGYTAMLSHELANRLGAAETAVQLLEESGPSLSEERSEKLHRLIRDSVHSGLQTVHSVRALFRQSLPGEPAPIRRLPLATMVSDAVHQMRFPADAKGVALELVSAGDATFVDAERLPLVLFNLVTNAVRHHDTPNSEGRVWIEVTRNEEGWTIEVRDNGPGIPEHLRDRIFEPLVRDPAGGGSGLGLAIAKEAVEQMGGEIEFEPAPERGTIFRFTVPRPED